MEGITGSLGYADLNRCLESAMRRLVAIWDQIGIENEQRCTREAVVLQHMNSLLEDMIEEEDLLRKRLFDNIQRFSVELFSLSEDLGLPPYVPEDDCSVLQLEKKLREKIGELKEEKRVRLERLLTLRVEDESLAKELSLPSYTNPPGAVPSLKYLESLKGHIKELQKVQEKREKEFGNIRNEIRRMLEQLAMKPDSSFDQDVINDPETIPLTAENIERAKDYHDQLAQLLTLNKDIICNLWVKIRALWNRLELPKEEMEDFENHNTNYSNQTIRQLKEELMRCEQQKLKNMENIIMKTRTELMTWWDKCYVLPEHRLPFKSFSDEPASEELLTRHEAQLQSVKAYYEENREILEKVARRQRLWQEFLTLERKARNPDRFLNRGGNLLKEEKARNKIVLDLPKIEQEVIAQVEAWEKTTGRRFLISGMEFQDYIQLDHENFAIDKENEKLARQQQKAKQIEEELLYGSKPATPTTKRFASNTPTKSTPNKMRKVGMQPNASVYGSQRNLTNLQSPFHSLLKGKLGGSTPKGLNTIGLNAKSHLAEMSKGPAAASSRKATVSTSIGVSSGFGDTVSSAKSLCSGKVLNEADNHLGSTTKHQKAKMEPYF